MIDENERFVERGTEYELEHGRLWVYETNIPCRNIKFKFGQYVLTLMLFGHKNIRSSRINFEFFPGTLFIPERMTEMAVTIPNATPTNPTQCLVLEINPDFIWSFSREMIRSSPPRWYADQNPEALTHFFSNDQLTIESFIRLYTLRKTSTTLYDNMIVTNALKELIMRVYPTEGGLLLMENCQERTQDALAKVKRYITTNLSRSISIAELSDIAGISKSSLFDKFKTQTGLTPVQYITRERIEYAKLLLGRSTYLKEAAYKCGFSNYEHFCKSFRKLEGLSPREYCKQVVRIA